MNRLAACNWTDLESLEHRLLFSGTVEGAVLPQLVGADLPAVQAEAPAVQRAGNEATSVFEVWRMGSGGWEKVTQSGVSGQDTPAVETVDSAGDWNGFMARIQHGDGSWSTLRAEDWQARSAAGNQAPTITITNPARADSVVQGQNYQITWNAADADGDATSVALWAFSWSTGWRKISGVVDGADGSFQWDTGAEWVQAGWYCFSAWVTDGQAWRGAISQEWVNVTAVVPDSNDGDGGADDGGGADGGEQAPDGFSAELAGGVLYVNGTDSDETISLSGWNGQVRVTCGQDTQDFSGVIGSVQIQANGGDDVVRIAHEVAANVTIRGGAGDDRLYAAGTGSDSLYGGEGNDLLISIGGGSDAVYGQDGVDSFWVDGSDSLHDATAAEYDRTSVHVVSQFAASWSDSPESPDYVSLEIAGQDLRDPEPTSTRYVYKDFSNRPLFVGAPSRRDVRQGYVGDCYYLASLASLADTQPQWIEEMLTDLGDGTYAVRFYSAGQSVYVRVDGEMPVWSASSNSPVYANLGHEGQLWVAVAEKAYAHFRYGQNSYDSLSGGWMSTVYRQVTDKYSSTVRVSGASAAALWQQLEGFLDSGRAVTVGSISQPDSPIVGYHAYTITDVSNEAGQLYVTVHNPWGIDGRNWDNNSSDGLMKITMDSFLNSFSYAIACYA